MKIWHVILTSIKVLPFLVLFVGAMAADNCIETGQSVPLWLTVVIFGALFAALPVMFSTES